MKQRNFWMWLVLSIVTCGIYSWVFLYGVVRDMNQFGREKLGDEKEQNFWLVILLTLVTCGIYYYVWLYNTGNRINDVAKAYGRDIHETGTTYILWLLFGSLLCGFGAYFSQYLLIRNLNLICGLHEVEAQTI